MEKKERNMRKQEDNYKDEVLSLRRVTKVTKSILSMEELYLMIL